MKNFDEFIEKKPFDLKYNKNEWSYYHTKSIFKILNDREKELHKSQLKKVLFENMIDDINFIGDFFLNNYK